MGHHHKAKTGFIIIGGIYSDQHCPLCNATFRDNHRDACACPDHPDYRATTFVVRFKKQSSRCRTYAEAERLLTGLRHEADRGRYDPRNYLTRTKPLSFRTLSNEWLEEKSKQISNSTYRHYKQHMSAALDVWGDRPVKTITAQDIKAFLFGLHVGEKTRHNAASCLHHFWRWVLEYDEETPIIERIPRFPQIRYELGYRTITTKDVQQRVLSEIHRRSPLRAWIAIKWLCTYVKLRPDDIRRITESSVFLDNGLVVIERPTKRRNQKALWLIPEDVEILKGLTRGMPQMPLFRHEGTGEVFGKAYLSREWNKACKAVGLEGVSLYAGTRHTSVTALQEHYSPDQIKLLGTEHDTNRAFERYLFPDKDQSIKMAEAASRAKPPS